MFERRDQPACSNAQLYWPINTIFPPRVPALNFVQATVCHTNWLKQLACSWPKSSRGQTWHITRPGHFQPRTPYSTAKYVYILLRAEACYALVLLATTFGKNNNLLLLRERQSALCPVQGSVFQTPTRENSLSSRLEAQANEDVKVWRTHENEKSMDGSDGDFWLINKKEFFTHSKQYFGDKKWKFRTLIFGVNCFKDAFLYSFQKLSLLTFADP